ncbi:hypothetical protein C1Y63_07345 [Corynebacterium sp. 13CS0277]|uniref:DUF4185 domain-containing protein n=1 Tax=Corynebacterium sp. 13CS0277 TaxID=2071994 RepID=UPI000D3F91F4|nr:DUF4185 domain-containing protein [Corynebacterium sp. 13CS0277]PRQ11198.1 hypothetical protein C1Y63_07345 [Corynebacterium sp. 13CS0277]
MASLIITTVGTMTTLHSPTRARTALLTVAASTAALLTAPLPQAVADPCTTYQAAAHADRARLRALGQNPSGSNSLSSGSSDAYDAAAEWPEDVRDSGQLSAGRNSPPWLRGKPGQLPVLRGHTEALHLLTGPGSPQRTHERFGIGGTDLGISFTDARGRMYFAFGDTMRCGGDLGWRSNVLLRTTDNNPADGIDDLQAWAPGGFRDSGYAGQFIPSLKDPGVEHTTIPTAGIAIGDTLYVDYMSVRSWGQPGEWVTNYAATMASTDGGTTWHRVEDSLRPNTTVGTPYGVGRHRGRAGEERTQQSALVARDGYVYRYSTPSGRAGDAILARFPEAQFPREDAAEFFVNGTWEATTPDRASAVFDAPVSEMSVTFNEHLQQYTAMYYSHGGMVLRMARHPQGPWSAPRVVVDEGTIPDLYGAFQLPSVDGNHLYFVATTWSNYNVMVMRTDLQQLYATPDPQARTRMAVPKSQGAATYNPRVDDGLSVERWVSYADDGTPSDVADYPGADTRSTHAQ